MIAPMSDLHPFRTLIDSERDVTRVMAASLAVVPLCEFCGRPVTESTGEAWWSSHRGHHDGESLALAVQRCGFVFRRFRRAFLRMGPADG